MQINKSNFKYLIGIDEVGRGPIAGPVAIGVFAFLKSEAKKLFNGVKESKQLSEEKREIWFKKIEETKNIGLKNNKNIIDFEVAFQTEKVIDKKGISFAIGKALETSLEKLIKKNKIKTNEVLILLDGGLKASSEYMNQKTIIKGDTKEKVIALASICAKVLRDRKMRKIAKKYPEYEFDINKGYGTKRHYERIKKYGLTDLHRKSFSKSFRKRTSILQKT